MIGSCVARDGRTVSWAEYGDPAGQPTLFLHGTPGGKLGAEVRHQVFAEHGLRVLSPDRAGYGATDALPGRTVLSNARDLLAILDAVEAENAYVVGGSGGGPHALALGVLAPERVKRVGVLVGAVPLTADEASTQIAFNRRAFAQLGDEAALRTVVTEGRRLTLEQGVAALLTDTPQSDQLARAAVADSLNATMQDALAPGIEGWVDDYQAIWRDPWGFEPEEVAVPVLWAHGSEDRNVPLRAARRFAERLPDVELVIWPGGHALTPELLDEFLNALVAA